VYYPFFAFALAFFNKVVEIAPLKPFAIVDAKYKHSTHHFKLFKKSAIFIFCFTLRNCIKLLLF